MGKLRAAPRPRPAGRRTRDPGALARRARWVPCSPGGSEGSAGPPPLRPPPRPAGPSPPLPRGHRGRGRARVGPPPTLPQPGRGRARSGDVKRRAVAAPPRALVKKKKKRGSET